MRRFIDIDLSSRSVTTRQLEGREIAECGRYLITRMLLDEDVADKDPWGRKTR